MAAAIRHFLPVVKQKKIKLAVRNTCEYCGGVFPLYILEVHHIGGPSSRINSNETLSAHEILVLCSNCGHAVRRQALRREVMRSLIMARSPEMHQAIQDILDNVSRSYHVSTDFDVAELFAEAYNLDNFDIFLNGA